MLLDKKEIFKKLDSLLESWKLSHHLVFLNEIAMQRVVRDGKIVNKVKVKRNGFKILRDGNTIKFVKMTQQEKRARSLAAKKAWREGKSTRINRVKRSLARSKIRMKALYGYN